MSTQENLDAYEVVVVGGGPAGQMAAMYSTRLGHRTALVGRGGGRAAMMQEVHNMIGIPEETSGNELLATGKEQLEAYGCTVQRDMITSCERTDDETVRLSGNNSTYEAEYVVLARGSRTCARTHHFPGLAADYTTVCTVTHTCSSTSPCT